MSYNSAEYQPPTSSQYNSGRGASYPNQSPPSPFSNSPSPEEPQQGILHGEALARDPFLEHYGSWIVIGFTAFFVLFLIVMNLAGQTPGQNGPLKWISDILQFVGEVIGLYFCVRIALRLRRNATQLRQQTLKAGQGPRNKATEARTEAQVATRIALAWTLLSIAIALYASGQAVWTSYDIRMPSFEVPFPGLYDIGFVGSYPFFLIGTLLITRRNRAAVGRTRLILDALAVIGASLALSWFFVLNPTIMGLSHAPSTGAAFLSIYFPAGDLFLVAIGAFLMFSPLASAEQQPVFLRLCVGLFLLAITDSLLGYFSLSPSGFNTGTLQDILWPLSMSMVGLAAIEYPRSVAREQERQARSNATALNTLTMPTTSRISQFSLTVQTVAPFILALLTAAILLTVVPNMGGRSLLLQADLIALALFIIVVIRQALTLIENNRLTLQMRGELAVSRRELKETRREANEATTALQSRRELEQGIATLQRVHAEVARGNFAVRAPTTAGPLLPIAQSLNLMLDRLSSLTQKAADYDHFAAEMQMLQRAIERLVQGQLAWDKNQLPPPVSIITKPVLNALLYLQHSQENLRQRVSSTIATLLNYNGKANEALSELESSPFAHQLPPNARERVAIERARRMLQQEEVQLHTLSDRGYQSSQTPRPQREAGHITGYLDQDVQQLPFPPQPNRSPMSSGGRWRQDPPNGLGRQ